MLLLHWRQLRKGWRILYRTQWRAVGRDREARTRRKPGPTVGERRGRRRRRHRKNDGRAVNQTRSCCRHSRVRPSRPVVHKSPTTLYLIHQADQLVHHVLEFLTASFHGGDLIANPREHVLHLCRRVHLLCSCMTIPAPFFGVNVSRNFSRADSFAKCEYGVRAALKRWQVFAAYCYFAPHEDRRKRLHANQLVFSRTCRTSHLQFKV
jgi:hypothetical protein